MTLISLNVSEMLCRAPAIYSPIAAIYGAGVIVIAGIELQTATVPVLKRT